MFQKVIRYVLLPGVVALGLAPGAPAEAAMVFATPGPGKGDVILSLVGTIRGGDDAKLAEAFAGARASGLRVVGIGLNGPGGETNTSLAIAKFVRERRLPVLIWSICASGCAIIAIAAPARIVGRRAMIAVHGAYRIGPDGKPASAPDATAYVADRLRGYGVPESVVRKLERTPFYGMAKLSRRDLAALDAPGPGSRTIR